MIRGARGAAGAGRVTMGWQCRSRAGRPKVRVVTRSLLWAAGVAIALLLRR